MGDRVYALLHEILGALLNTWLPLLLLLVFVASFMASRTRQQGRERRVLYVAVTLTAVMWAMLYGEHYTHGSIPLFDYGAPLASFVVLVVLPALWILHVMLSRGLPLDMYKVVALVSAYMLFLISVVPGIYLVLFYGASV